MSTERLRVIMVGLMVSRSGLSAPALRRTETRDRNRFQSPQRWSCSERDCSAWVSLLGGVVGAAN